MRIKPILAALWMAAAAAAPFPARAEDPTSKPATTAPAASGAAIDVKEKDKLKGMIGQDATIRGKVIEVFVPQSGTVTIFNFEGIGRRDFNVVVDKANLETVNAGFNGDVA